MQQQTPTLPLYLRCVASGLSLSADFEGLKWSTKWFYGQVCQWRGSQRSLARPLHIGISAALPMSYIVIKVKKDIFNQ
jgi:hypothetical protein